MVLVMTDRDDSQENDRLAFADLLRIGKNHKAELWKIENKNGMEKRSLGFRPSQLIVSLTSIVPIHSCHPSESNSLPSYPYSCYLPLCYSTGIFTNEITDFDTMKTKASLNYGEISKIWNATLIQTAMRKLTISYQFVYCYPVIGMTNNMQGKGYSYKAADNPHVQKPDGKSIKT